MLWWLKRIIIVAKENNYFMTKLLFTEKEGFEELFFDDLPKDFVQYHAFAENN